MARHLIDAQTANTLLSGALDPADAPPAYAEVARTFRAVQGPPTEREFVRMSETISAMATVVGTSPAAQPFPAARGPRRARVLRPRRLAVVLLALSLGAALGLGLVSMLKSPDRTQPHPGPTVSPPSYPQDITSAPRGREGLRPHHDQVTNDPAAPRQGPVRNVPDGRDLTRAPKHHAATGGARSTEATGLCTAYFAGRGGERGEKLASHAFAVRLHAMAAAEGLTVAQLCDSGAQPGVATSAGDDTSRTPSPGKGNRGNGHTRAHRDDRSADRGRATRPSRARHAHA